MYYNFYVKNKGLGGQIYLRHLPPINTPLTHSILYFTPSDVFKSLLSIIILTQVSDFVDDEVFEASFYYYVATVDFSTV